MRNPDSLSEQILSHMLQRIEAAVDSTHPYPHFWVDYVFPTDVYQWMMSEFPSATRFQPVAARHTNFDGSSNRDHFPLHGKAIERLDANSRALWQAVGQVMRSESLRQAVYRKLSAGLSYRYRVAPTEVDHLPGVASPRIYRETGGYAIAPHPDTRKKVVTLQFALPVDDSSIDLGTGIFVRSLRVEDWAQRPYGFRGFRKVGQYPFEPNSAFAFSVINTAFKKSWHGREPLIDDRRERRSILNVYYEQAEYDELRDAA